MVQIIINVRDQHIGRLLDTLVGLYDNHLTEGVEPGSDGWSKARRARWLHRWLLLRQIQRWEKSQATETHVAPIAVDESVIDPTS